MFSVISVCLSVCLSVVLELLKVCRYIFGISRSKGQGQRSEKACRCVLLFVRMVCLRLKSGFLVLVFTWLHIVQCFVFVVVLYQVRCEAMHRRRSNITRSLCARELGLGWRQQCIPSSVALRNYAELIASQPTKNEVWYSLLEITAVFFLWFIAETLKSVSIQNMDADLSFFCDWLITEKNMSMLEH